MPDATKSALKCQEALARAVAMTKGEGSAAARALAEFIRRRAAGEDIVMFPLRGKWLVAPAADIRTESDRVGELCRVRGVATQLESARKRRAKHLATRA